MYDGCQFRKVCEMPKGLQLNILESKFEQQLELNSAMGETNAKTK